MLKLNELVAKTNYGPGLLEKLKGRHFLTLADFQEEELRAFIDLGLILKEELKKGHSINYLPGKTLGMVFEKPSTRTRVSFEAGIYRLGGMGLFLSKNDLQLARKEPLKDTGRVLSSYLDGIMVRTHGHELLKELAVYSSVPVINGLTDSFHPCQVMADLMTVKEEYGSLKGVKLAYLGDGNNMANSLMLGCSKMGMEIAVATPRQFTPQEEIINTARSEAERTGGKVSIMADPQKALTNADVITTDVWVSMGADNIKRERPWGELAKHQINRVTLNKAKEKAIVLHCLPAHRGEEITDEVMEGKNSRIFRQAENRMHVQNAIMAVLMTD